MTRPALLRLLACLLAAAAAAVATVVLTPAVTVADDTSGTRTSLRVTIETLTPSTIPQRGRVTLTGRIVNRSQQTWTSLNVYLLTSPDPIRSRPELARAAATAPDEQIGARRTSEGLYDKVGDLTPGASVRYRLSVRRADLGISGRPGVYWVGVHVLGAVGGVRDAIADGRARTFMPLLPAPGTPAAERARTRLALVVPLRQPVHRGSAGRLLDVQDWNTALSPDGRLGRLLRLSRGARQPITWVVDPALLDAVRSVARDNPPVETEPAGSSDGSGGSPSAGPSQDPSDGSTPSSGSTAGGTAGSDDGSGGPAAEPSATAQRARRWLDEFRRQAPTHTVAGLPYGDLDVASVLGNGLSSIYQRAAALSADALTGYGVDDAPPVVAPTSGYLPTTALRRLSGAAPVVLHANTFPRAPGPVIRDGRTSVVLTDASAGDGGPGPNSQYAALAVRQRLLGDAALHALSGSRDASLVVSMPDRWDPGDAWARSNFFGGLDQPWLRMLDLPSVVAAAEPDEQIDARSDAGTAVYPQADRTAQVPLSNLRATQDLVRTGGIFARLLSANDTVDADLARIAMLASSTNARTDSDLARAQTAGTTDEVRSRMALVRIEGPPFVMMSGESGPIQVTLVNGLDQPVTVGLKMSTPGSNLRIAPFEPVRLGPGRRTSTRLVASSDDIGVHSVTLVTTDADGTPLGSQTQFSVRTSHVSTVIWVIMAAAGVLLLLAIVIRLFRRVRRRQATHGPLLHHESCPPGRSRQPEQEHTP